MMQCLQYLLTAEKGKKDRQAAINKRERHIERYDNIFFCPGERFNIWVTDKHLWIVQCTTIEKMFN